MRKIFTSISVFVAALFVSGLSFAEEVASAAGQGDSVKVALACGAAFTIAIAAFGGALGQSKAAVAALEGIGRNPAAAPKVQTPMIIAMALMEFLVIMAFIIAFLLQDKI